MDRLEPSQHVFRVTKITDTAFSYQYLLTLRLSYVESINAVAAGEFLTCAKLRHQRDPNTEFQVRFFPKGFDEPALGLAEGLAIHVVMTRARRTYFDSSENEPLMWISSRFVTVDEVVLVAQDGKAENYARRLRGVTISKMQSISFNGTFIKHDRMAPYIDKNGEIEFRIKVKVKIPSTRSSFATCSRVCQSPPSPDLNSLPKNGFVFMKGLFLADSATNLTFVCPLPNPSEFEPKFGSKEGDNWVYHVHKELACKNYFQLPCEKDFDRENDQFWRNGDLVMTGKNPVDLKDLEAFLVLAYNPDGFHEYLDSFEDLLSAHSLGVLFNGVGFNALTSYVEQLIIQHVLGLGSVVKDDTVESGMAKFTKQQAQLIRAGFVHDSALHIENQNVTEPESKGTKEIIADLEILMANFSGSQFLAMEQQLSRLLVFLIVMETCPTNELFALLKKYNAPSSLLCAIVRDLGDEQRAWRRLENRDFWQNRNLPRKFTVAVPGQDFCEDSLFSPNDQDFCRNQMFGPARRRRPLIDFGEGDWNCYGARW